MTTVARPNRDALTKAIDIYRDAMRPFLLRSLRRIPNSNVEASIQRSLPDRQADNFLNELGKGIDVESALDVNFFPSLVGNYHNWKDAFSAAFNGDKTVQNELWIISDARNQISHPGTQDLEEEYTRTNLYLIADVLGKINEPELKRQVEEIRDSLVSVPPISDTQATMEDPTSDDKASVPGQSQRSNSNLKPWREVIRPNQDVAQGSYQQAEFMAELQLVRDGRADNTQYGNPVSFFEHTYITPGMRELLINALKRLNGIGGDPVIQTKTGFGGGKTHSLIALYHLVRNADALLNPQPGSSTATAEQIRSIIDEAGYTDNPEALGEIAVLDGTYLGITDQRKTEAGDPLNTLWGVMAYELAKQPGYDIIAEAARQGVAPSGSQLDELLDYVGPCVILIDELVNYIRNAGYMRDNVYTFVQNLTQAVIRSKDAIMVVTLPQSREEAGGEGGAEAMDRLDNILARVEAVWEPLAVNETFEVVRRRLFGPLIDESAMTSTCEAFSRMYSNNRREYPQGVSEQNYLERIKACYPVHPEIFDRLYLDWSSIQDFQRTRGVLRMLSTCVNRLYMSNSQSYLIMPADVPLSDPTLANEFLRLLRGNWRPVVTEADSDNSRTDNIDKESQRFAELGGAARRVARTIFMGSAEAGATKGIDQRQLHLGTVQPGEGVATYNEALNRMVGDLYFLYNDNDRYFFHAEENLNKVANDRAEGFTEKQIDDYITTVLEEVKNRRGDVIIYAGDSSEIGDHDFVRLVILPPSLSLPTRAQETDTAGPEALKILLFRADAPRTKRNTLLFLTAKRDEIRALRNEVRNHLAWDSIINGATRLQGLSGDRLSQATVNNRNSDRNAKAAAVRAFRWALAPVQSDPQKAEFSLNQTQIDATETADIVSKTLEKLIQEEALVTAISPSALNGMLNQYLWGREDSPDHLSIDYVWELLTNHVYMHRLKDKSVLLKCVEEGVVQGTFGYATGHDGQAYSGLRYQEPQSVASPIVAERNVGFLVKPDVAARQKDEPAPKPGPQDGTSDPGPGGNEEGEGGGKEGPPPPPPPPPAGPSRITARKVSGGDISLDDINTLRDEIIRNLSADGGEVTVEIIVSAQKADGFSESITRSVRENSVQLGLQFETNENE